MVLKPIIYTTEQTNFFELELIERYVGRTKGLSMNRIKVVPVILKNPKVVDGRFDFDWLNKHVFKDGYNAYCLHISKAERRKFGLKRTVNGFYNVNEGDNSFEFVVISNKGQQATHYPFGEFARLFMHELSHGFDHWQHGKPNINTHRYDYDLRAIHTIFEKEHSFVQWKLLYSVKTLLTSLLGLIPLERPVNPITQTAEKALGRDISPRDLALDELGCAESVSNILKQVYPDFPIITGTWTLWDKLQKDKRFIEVAEPKSGDIIISPTGTVEAPYPGHVGIVGRDGIMSNSSDSGNWEKNFTLKSWEERYGKVGYPIYFFRVD